MNQRKRIALIAHDGKKKELLNWVIDNKESLQNHELCGTGTTGGLIAENCGLNVKRYKSGPLGGDQQIGALISDEGLDIMIFFWDPMTAQPHDVDVKALLRMSVLYNVVVACNRASADYLITSPLFHTEYTDTEEDE
ncbi:MAG: methylglyoxal synthase [Desulfobacteraceae bacterium]|jgi:methylglyoxal synthase